VQTHEVDTRAASARPNVAREQIPQAQRRERNRLRPVRIEAEQPRPDQAV
jgi:hypothetical protein